MTVKQGNNTINKIIKSYRKCKYCEHSRYQIYNTNKYRCMCCIKNKIVNEDIYRPFCKSYEFDDSI